MVLGGKNRDRKIEPAPVGTPFFSKGNTWRGEWELPKMGWYVIVAGELRGPFTRKVEAK